MQLDLKKTRLFARAFLFSYLGVIAITRYLPEIFTATIDFKRLFRALWGSDSWGPLITLLISSIEIHPLYWPAGELKNNGRLMKEHPIDCLDKNYTRS